MRNTHSLMSCPSFRVGGAFTALPPQQTFIYLSQRRLLKSLAVPSLCEADSWTEREKGGRKSGPSNRDESSLEKIQELRSFMKTGLRLESEHQEPLLSDESRKWSTSVPAVKILLRHHQSLTWTKRTKKWTMTQWFSDYCYVLS
ncbi:Hypothetical predicted protein [Xyrichtys novacula]|uniref:Uncharacterized protein n=1 Tax=Xyrichtys novacula TaxID=13765 RepID=A0AAV1HDF3_XYRNO|nr:Hypothetical predicted protein [Xyrichtys novacula]